MVDAERQSFTFGDKDLMNFYKTKYYKSSEEFGFFNDKGDLGLDVFQHVWNKMDPSKSPGSPLTFVATTNAGLDIIRWQIYDTVNDRLKALIELGKIVWDSKHFKSSNEEHSLIATSLLAKGITDPVLLGPKGEARAVGKHARLVCQVSSAWTLMSRVIIGNSLLQEQEMTGIATATQLDLTTPARTERFRQILSEQGKLHTSDVEGWEYSFNESDTWVSCFGRLYENGLLNDDWTIVECDHSYAIIALYYCDIHRVVETPEGSLLITRPGQMSSGRLGTFSDNSIARSWLSEKISLMETGKPVKFVISAGDDNLDSNKEKYDKQYLWFGKKITDFHENEEIYNFCSTTFTSTGSYQDNIEKSAYSVIVRRIFDPETLSQFDASFLNHPDYKEYYDLILRFAALYRENAHQ